MKSGKVVLGVLAGLAAGAVLGILFAPDKGEKTRKKMMKKQEELKDNLKAKFESTKKDLADLVENTKEKLTQKKNNVAEDVSAN